MKQQAFRTMTHLSLFVMLAATSAFAQAKSPLQANIPFNFIVGGKTLPAGTYILERIDRQTIQETVLIRSADGRASGMVRMMPGQTKSVQAQARLIFNRYGERFFLSQLVAPGGDLELPKSRIERALERELAGRDQSKTGRERMTLILASARSTR
jgi:hypothetical protein